jgi:hypothetical protein
METEFYSLIMYCIPALLTGAVAYLFFNEYTNNENKRRHYILHKSLQKEVLPVKLQAYERLTLVLERMAPNNLLIRIQPISQRKEDYEQLLIQTIEQEFEHNSSTADKFRELVLTKSMDIPSPSNVALAYLKNEVSLLLTY